MAKVMRVDVVSKISLEKTVTQLTHTHTPLPGLPTLTEQAAVLERTMGPGNRGLPTNSCGGTVPAHTAARIRKRILPPSDPAVTGASHPLTVAWERP